MVLLMKRSSKKKQATKYRSKFEATVAKELEELGYKYEAIKLEYTIPESKHTYTPDFIKDKTIIEVKGLWSKEDRDKMLFIQAQYPEYTVIMFFQNPKLKIYKGSKTTYADFCEKHGIEWMQL